MAFNFGNLKNTSSQATVSRRLKPFDIYKVKFEGCRIDHVQKKDDPEQSWDILKIRFSNDQGYYEESVFYPKDGDEKRPSHKVTDPKTGVDRDVESPSSFERTMALVAQVAGVLNPEGFVKMQELSPKFKSFDDVAKTLIKITDPKKDTEVNLKLIGKKNKEGNVEPCLPYFVNVNRNGEVYTSDNFLGDKVFLSDYDLKQKAKLMSATPTPMEKSSVGGSEDLQLTEAKVDNSDLTDDSIADLLSDL
jgi:hypothetical protein